jgi:beta-lactamase regulating signal transducer with metallopeptidase domain
MNTLITYLSDPIAEAIGWTIVHSLWQGTLIGVLALLFLKLRNNAPVQLRYLTGILAMAAILISSVLTFLMEYQPALEYSTQGSSLSGVNSAATGPVPGSGFSFRGTGEKSIPAFEQLFGPALPWMSMVWMAGVMLFSLRLVGGLIFAHRLKRRGISPLPLSWTTRLEALVLRSGIRRKLNFLISRKVMVPMVIGFLRPVVLIPAGIISLMPVDQLESVLAHEIAHIRRYDFLVNVLQSLIEALFFYHPVIWILSSNVRQEREKCCDDFAVSICGKLSVYARALAGLGEISTGTALHSVAITGNRNKILNRVERLINTRKMKTYAREKMLAGLLILGCVIILTFSTGASLSPTKGQTSYQFNLEAITSGSTETAGDDEAVEVAEETETAADAEAAADAETEIAAEAEDLADPSPAAEISPDAAVSPMAKPDSLEGHELRDMEVKDNIVTREFINKDGEEMSMKFVIRKGEVVELYVNGKEIQESGFPDYEKEIERTKRDLREMDRELREAREEIGRIDWEEIGADIESEMEYFRQHEWQNLREEMQQLQQERMDIQIDHEKMQEELRRAMEDSKIDQEKMRREMMMAREEAARAMQEFRDGKYGMTEEQFKEMEEAMARAMQEIEAFDRERMQEIFERELQAIQEIDYEKIQMDIEKAIKEIETINFEEIEREIRESIKQLEMEKFHLDKEMKSLDEMILELEKLELEED